MQIILRSRGLLSIVDGSRAQPEETADDARSKAALVCWRDDDAKAQELIITRVQEKVLTHLLTCKTSYDIWQKLSTIYEPKSKVSVHLIQQRFFNLKFEEPVNNFISRLEDLKQQLQNLGEQMTDTMMMTKILMTLPDKYKHFVSAWESVPEKDQSFQSLVSRLLLEEERYGNTEQEQATAFVARNQCYNKNNKQINQNNRGAGQYNKSVSELKCFECGHKGHLRKDCRKRKCHFCHKAGHLIKDCKNLNNTKHSVSDSQNQNAFIVSPMTDVDNQFYLDSGCSAHMSPDKNLFINYEEVTNEYVTVGDGKRLKAVGKGKIDVSAFNGDNYLPTSLSDVLYVPELTKNLFSMRCALDKGYTMIATATGCKLLKEGRVCAIANRVGKMYVMDFKFDHVALLSLSEWHERMAHQNYKYVKQCLESNNIKYEGPTDQCSSCVEGKQHRTPFSASVSRAESPGELLHMDLCGEMTPASLGGSLYFLLIKDDYSSYRYVYFLRHKSETKNKIEEFIEEFENQFNCKIKRVRSDNGKEFINREVEKIFKAKGIIHETTVSYTPEQNGRIEREMRTIVESARTMIIQAGQSKELWAEAVNTAVFTINRTGVSKVEGKTPYELLYERSFDIQKLRIFGSEVFIHVPKGRTKWDSKSKRGIFVGYGDHCKGYRIWIPNTKRVETYRDVVFVQKKNPEEIKQSEETELEVCIPEESKKCDIDEVTVEGRDESAASEQIQTHIEETESEMCEIEMLEEHLEDEFYDAELEQDNIEERRKPPRRQVKKPAWLEEYDTVFVAQTDEQLSFREATTGEDSKQWFQAIEKEIEALNKNNTWTETQLPKGKKPIEAKWVFKIKNEGNGKVKYKARLVARGFQQREKFDYCDADWGGDEDRKSTSGYIMKVYGCTISWASSKQQCVSLSSTEAEFVALAKGVSEACWVRNLLNEIGIQCCYVYIFEDNQSVIHTSKNPENHKRLKHIDIKYHFVRDFVERKIVKLQYVSTENQLADILTKPLSCVKFENCRDGLMLV